MPARCRYGLSSTRGIHFGRWCSARRNAAELLLISGARTLALQHRLRRRIGLLKIDAPVAQFLERNRRAGHGAAHEGAWPHDTEIAVEIFDFGLAGHRLRAVGAVEQIYL